MILNNESILQPESLNDKRIAVLLSGGVDSSVVLYELVRQGLQPDCFYIKIGPEEEEEWDCSSEEDLEMATAVSHKYGCRLEVIDCHREYWDQVTTYTMNKVRAGMTPNPDVMCNRLIKFGAFHEKRGHDYDLIATGHYAQKEQTLLQPLPLSWLCTSPDPVKDQTDFLAQIYDWQLAKALFPIGHMMKEEVRAIAEREHLAPAHRRDSQGICFLGKINYNDYLRRYLGELPGDVVELETGRIVGHHKGHWFHTIGQRKGMGLGGGPWFVIKKDIQQNIVYVSHGYDPQTAYCQHFRIRDFHHLTLPLEQVQSSKFKVQSSSTKVEASKLEAKFNVTIKIRHTPEFLPAQIESTETPGEYIIHAAAPIHGVAPGQFCVVYDADHHRCFGSGEIALHSYK